jgi:hypothetical protein
MKERSPAGNFLVCVSIWALGVISNKKGMFKVHLMVTYARDQ